MVWALAGGLFFVVLVFWAGLELGRDLEVRKHSSQALDLVRENVALRARVDELYREAVAGYQLSTYAAAIHWGPRDTNTQDWLDGLRARIELVQHLHDAKKS